MKKAVVITTWINYILSILLWILGIFFLVFNLLGKWTAWHLAGFGYLYFMVYPFIASCLAILLSAINKEPKLRKKHLWHNGIVLGISTAVTILSFTVSAAWFW